MFPLAFLKVPGLHGRQLLDESLHSLPALHEHELEASIVYVAINPCEFIDESDVNTIFITPADHVIGFGTDDPLNGLPANSDTDEHIDVLQE